MTRTLVAGVGNVFFGDDGFGPEVVRVLASRPQPEGVTVRDFGVRAGQLAHELTAGWERIILVDAMPVGRSPGALEVLEPLASSANRRRTAAARTVDLRSVFAMVHLLGKPPRRLFVIGAEALELRAHVGLSPPVQAAVATAVERIEAIVRTAEDEAHAPYGGGF